MTVRSPVQERTPAPVPIRATVRETLQLLSDYPRQTILPMLAIEGPVALISAIATAILYLTVFAHDPIRTNTDLLSNGSGGPLFALFAISAFEVLFAQVARGATITGVAAARRGERLALPQLLDPAFTRMGALLALAVISTAVLVLGVITAFTFIGAILALFIFLRWAVAFEGLILEDRGVFDAFRRSWSLMHGNMLRYLAVLVLSVVVVIVPLVAISLLEFAIGGGRTAEIATTAIVTALQGILVVPLVAFLTAVTTMFYFRVKERMDDRTAPGK